MLGLKFIHVNKGGPRCASDILQLHKSVQIIDNTYKVGLDLIL